MSKDKNATKTGDFQRAGDRPFDRGRSIDQHWCTG